MPTLEEELAAENRQIEESDLVSAVENPDVVEEAARQVTAGTLDKPPAIAPSQDGPITLPGGTRVVKVTDSGTRFEEVTTAWVRELNGFDEERIAKAQRKGDPSAFIEAMLEAGVERLGDERPTLGDLRGLLTGDRDYLLLEISRATYGDELEFEKFACPHCGELLDFTVSKSEDIPVRRLDKVDDQVFELTGKNGTKYNFHLPTGDEQSMASKSDTNAEFNTQLLASCVTEFGGDLDEAKKLGVVDRKKFVTELVERMPGPQYNEVEFECLECDRKIRVGVSLVDLFPGLGA